MKRPTHNANQASGAECAAGPATTNLAYKETPEIVEPTLAGLQPAAWPSGSSVELVARPGFEPRSGTCRAGVVPLDHEPSS
jgi:hypothetical protein